MRLTHQERFFRCDFGRLANIVKVADPAIASNPYAESAVSGMVVRRIRCVRFHSPLNDSDSRASIRDRTPQQPLERFTKLRRRKLLYRGRERSNLKQVLVFVAVGILNHRHRASPLLLRHVSKGGLGHCLARSCEKKRSRKQGRCTKEKPPNYCYGAFRFSRLRGGRN